MEQKTLDWLQWRHQGIGASDVPIIMGVSPYKKPYALFSEKILPEPPPESSNYILEKGNRKEPIARAKMEIELGIDLKPVLLTHTTIPVLRMSSDGLNFDHKINIEVKYVGKEFVDECPEKYYPQLQHQHFVLGEGWVNYYVQINDNDEIRYFKVDVDMAYIKEQMLPACSKFWQMVKAKEWTIEKELKDNLNKYKEAKEKFDQLEEELDKLKKEIFSVTGDKFNYDIFTVSTVTKKGEVDYKKIVEEKLPNIDLNGYLKKGTSYKQIRIKKPKEAKEAA